MSDEFWKRCANNLIRATAEQLKIPLPADGADRILLLEAVRRDNTFVSEEHPRFTAVPLIVQTYTGFAAYYARVPAEERASIVGDALSILRNTTE